MKEIFERIPDSNNEISNFGNIRNAKTKRDVKLYIPRKRKGKVDLSKKIYQLDEFGNLIKIFNTIKECKKRRYIDSFGIGYWWLSEELWLKIRKSNKIKRIKKLISLYNERSQ